MPVLKLPRWYKLRRGKQAAGIALCARHLEARKILGWTADRGQKLLGDWCVDCSRTEPTILERVVEAAEKAAEKQEPQPVPADPRQGTLL